MRLISSLFAVGFLTATACFAGPPFLPLYDLDTAPLIQKGVRTKQVSSYDPSGGNGDAGHYVRIEGNVKVMADLKGPGIVRRIWSANPSGQLRIYIDGAETPVVDTPFTDLFENKTPGFRPPLADKSSGGWYSYVPIPFKKSCLITATDSGFFYYQVTWQEVPETSIAASFTGTWTGVDAVGYDKAVTAWSKLGTNTPSLNTVNLPQRKINLAPRGTWAQPIVGPGTLTSLRFEFAKPPTFQDLRRVILRITFDDAKTPQVETPLADFFGVGFEGVSWRSLPLGFTGKAAYCYFRMPFKKSARVELVNTGTAPFLSSFKGMARSGVPQSAWGYFHADYRTAVNNLGAHYVVARLRGKGHVVGVTQSMRGIGNQWFLEGDEKIYVDGAKFPDIYGTGTEDYYNCGWYFNTGLVNVATHGCVFKAETEIGAYRLHFPDVIPFEKTLDFDIEHGGTNDVPGSEYATVVYWYGTTGSRDQRPELKTGNALLPQPHVPLIPGQVEAERTKWAVATGATMKNQSWHEITSYRGGGRALLTGGIGAAATTPINIVATDNYEIDVSLSGSERDSIARLTIDGAPVGQPFRVPAGPLPLTKGTVGPVLLTQGRHTLGFVLDSGPAVGIDGFRLKGQSPLITTFAVLGPYLVNPTIGVNEPLPPDGKEPSLSQVYRTPDGRSLKWSIVRAPSGILDLGAAMTPNIDTVGYASFAIHSPEDKDVSLLVGSDDGIKVYLNGTPLYTKRVARALVEDQDHITLSLKKGWNTVLLKVDQGAVLWTVCARVTDPDGVLRLAALAGED